MFLRKKAQSTAEYAIVLGLVIAVAVGVTQQMLKSGMRQKNKQALNYLMSAGDDKLPVLGPTDKEKIYSEDWRKTTVSESTDESAMKKGGYEEKKQKQTAKTDSVSIELIDAIEK